MKKFTIISLFTLLFISMVGSASAAVPTERMLTLYSDESVIDQLVTHDGAVYYTVRTERRPYPLWSPNVVEYQLWRNSADFSQPELLRTISGQSNFTLMPCADDLYLSITQNAGSTITREHSYVINGSSLQWLVEDQLDMVGVFNDACYFSSYESRFHPLTRLVQLWRSDGQGVYPVGEPIEVNGGRIRQIHPLPNGTFLFATGGSVRASNNKWVAPIYQSDGSRVWRWGGNAGLIFATNDEFIFTNSTFIDYYRDPLIRDPLIGGTLRVFDHYGNEQSGFEQFNDSTRAHFIGILDETFIFSDYNPYDNYSARQGGTVWATDGRTLRTVSDKSLRSCGGVFFKDKIFFCGSNGTSYDEGEHTRTLWTTDGYTITPFLSYDIPVGHLQVIGDRLYFMGNVGNEYQELFSTDGTLSGTKRLSTISAQETTWPRLADVRGIKYPYAPPIVQTLDNHLFIPALRDIWRLTLSTPPNDSADSEDTCVIPHSGPWPECAKNGNGTPAESPTDERETCLIPVSGPWPACARNGGGTQ